MSIKTTRPPVNFYGIGTGTTSSSKTPFNPIIMNRVPTVYDVKGDDGFFQIGQVWIDTTYEDAFILVAVTSGSPPLATWVFTGGGASTLSALKSDSGKALPSSSAITIGGTTNEFGTSASGSTVTLAASATFTSPGPITSMGDMTAAGSFVRNLAGSKDVYSSYATSDQAGDHASGIVNLTSGTVLVSTTAVTASSLIRLYRQSPSNSTKLGFLFASPTVVGISFTIFSNSYSVANSLQTGDFSEVFWEIVN